MAYDKGGKSVEVSPAHLHPMLELLKNLIAPFSLFDETLNRDEHVYVND